MFTTTTTLPGAQACAPSGNFFTFSQAEASAGASARGTVSLPSACSSRTVTIRQGSSCSATEVARCTAGSSGCSVDVPVPSSVASYRFYACIEGTQISDWEDLRSVIPTRADLIVDSITISPANPALGQTATFTAVVKNVGTETGSFHLQARFRLDINKDGSTDEEQNQGILGGYLQNGGTATL